MTAPKHTASSDQAEKFKQAARELEADEDEGRWEERLKKIARQKAGADRTDNTKS